MELIYSNVVKGVEKEIQGFQIYYLSSSNEIKITSNKGNSKKILLNAFFTKEDLCLGIREVLEEKYGLEMELELACISSLNELYKLKRKENEILFEVTGTRDVMNGGIIFSISNDEITHKILIPYEKKDWLINLEAHLSFLSL